LSPINQTHPDKLPHSISSIVILHLDNMYTNAYCKAFNSLPPNTTDNSTLARELLLGAFAPLLKGADCEGERTLNTIMTCVSVLLFVVLFLLFMWFILGEVYLGRDAIATLKAHDLAILSPDEIWICMSSYMNV